MNELPITYNGFRAKTVNIRTYTGSTKFQLQQSNELGLPKGSIIVGIMVRNHTSAKIASNYKPLVDQTVFDNAYLSLKSHKEDQGISLILDNYYLPNALDRTPLFEPIESSCIDWNSSFITINKRALPSLVDNSVIELVILYREFPENICTLPNCFLFRTGTELLGTRRSRKEIQLVAAQLEYPLSNSTNIGIPREAWLVGYTTLKNEFPLKGEPMDNDALNSTYITFKRKTDSFIELFPVELQDYQDQLLTDLDYFPMEPMKVLDMDWESSKLNIVKDATVADGQVFQIEFVYVMADANGLLTTGGNVIPNV